MMSKIELGSVFNDDTVAKTTKPNKAPSFYKHRHSSTDYRVGCTRYSGSQIIACSAREWTLDDQTETRAPKLNSGCKCPLPGAENAHGDRLFVNFKSRRISVYDNSKSRFVTLGYFSKRSDFSLLAFDAEDCVVVTYKHDSDADYEEDSGPDVNMIQLFCTDGSKPRRLVTGAFCGMYYDRYTNFLYYIQQVKDRFELMSMNIAGDEPILIAPLHECHCPRDLQYVAGDPVTKVIVWLSSYDKGKSKVSYAEYTGSKPVTPTILYEVQGELKQLSITGDLLLWINYDDNALRSYHLISKTEKYVAKCPGRLLYEKPSTNTYNKTFTFTCVEKVRYTYRSRMTMYDMQGAEVDEFVLPCRDPLYVG
ncbi:uncharacterized protein LOC124271608 [Haliotis rubra]|uniref:uncharacterized protein LOC124271608 n=1 Tax=Haliotis rubra TaxID=36100 RepID=UPI001EE56EBD|nr:uncharacterized protein LOC124271608 [Haliotis rubra]